MQNNPLISVIMSVYNTPEVYLREAINSILKQTYKNFEFIMIDDFSDKKTQKVMQDFHDTRIHVYRNPENYGLTKSLNEALKHCNGEYIARMDSDDIALPERFQIQINWMNEHQECGVCGSLVEMYGGKITYSIRWNRNHEVKRVRMLFYDAGIVHPTAMIRKSVLDQNHICYNNQIKKAQDYALWSEMIQVTDIQLIPKVLLKYRVSDTQISSMHHDEQIKCEFMTIRNQLKRYNLSDEEENIICHFYRGQIQNAILLNSTLKKIIQQNHIDHFYNIHTLTQQITVLYTQASIKQMKRYHCSSMICSSFFWRILNPVNLLAFLHYMLIENISS